VRQAWKYSSRTPFTWRSIAQSFLCFCFQCSCGNPADLKINNEMVELSGILGRLQRDQMGRRGWGRSCPGHPLGVRRAVS